MRYVGEVGDDGKRELYTSARALLMPIRWAEPFGMAMACGAPVVAFPEGAAPDVVLDGETGFLVDDERAIGRLSEIDRGRCRASVNERFDVPLIVARHAEVFERVRARGGRFRRRRAASAPPRHSGRSEASARGLD